MRWRALPLLLCAGALPAAAQDCANATTQTEMNACAAAAYQGADDRLNGVYKQAAAAARLSGGEAPAQLLAAQRAWIGYRDAACAAEAGLYAGGTMQPLVQANCMKTLTERRTEDLRAAYLSN